MVCRTTIPDDWDEARNWSTGLQNNKYVLLSCRVCGSVSLKIIKHFPGSRWILCRNCLLLQRVLPNTYERSFVENTDYKWGLSDNNWSEKKYSQEIHQIRKGWEYFLSKAGICSPKKVMDFGSGTGPLLEYLKSQNIDALGIEISKANGDFSRRKGHKVITEPIREDMFDLETFDVVNISLAGTYVRNVFDTFRIFHRILKPNGVIFWSDRVYNWSALRAGSNLHRQGPAAYFSFASLHNLLALSGFKISHFKNRFGTFSLVARKATSAIPLGGSYCLELATLRMLPITDSIMPHLLTVREFLVNVRNHIRMARARMQIRLKG